MKRLIRARRFPGAQGRQWHAPRHWSGSTPCRQCRRRHGPGLDHDQWRPGRAAL